MIGWGLPVMCVGIPSSDELVISTINPNHLCSPTLLQDYENFRIIFKDVLSNFHIRTKKHIIYTLVN